MRGNEKMEKRKKIKNVKREVESVTFLVRVGCMRSRSELGAATAAGCRQQVFSTGLFYCTAKEFQVASKYLGADSSSAVVMMA